MNDFRHVSRRRFLRLAGTAGATGMLALPTGALLYPQPTVGAGFVGYAIDQLTLRPVAGALVQADPLGIQTTTDLKGAYVLRVPPGSYTIRVGHDGYLGGIKPDQTVSSGFATLDLDLIPSYPTPAEQEVLYQRLVKQTESPLHNPRDLMTNSLRAASTGFSGQITVLFPDGSTQQMSLEDYVKGVVPNEVPASWPAAALQAQAVASRSYGLAEYNAYGYVCTTTSCQVYDPSNRWPSTDAAVDATAGQVMTVGGATIFAFFFSRCNAVSTRNSEDAIGYETNANGYIIYDSNGKAICTSGGWNYVSYCRARGCGGHNPSSFSECGYYGHGVGMCQWGCYAHGNGGSSYQDILNSYYTGVTINGTSAPPTATPIPTFTPTPTPTPIPVPRLYGPFLAEFDRQPVTFSWSNLGSGFTYSLTVTPLQGNGFPLGPYFIGSNYLTLPQTLPLGWYTWTVQTSVGTSASGTLEIVPKVYNTNLPLAGNG